MRMLGHLDRILGDAELRPSAPSPQIMAMPAALRPFTVEEIEAFPDDGNRYELLYGVLLVTPVPGLPHQTVASRLLGLLAAFLKEEPGLEVWSPGVVQIRPSIHLEPDILIGKLPPIPRWDAVQDHWLAVEVSGTASRVYDRDYKRDGYLGIGIKQVWLVDLDTRQFLVSQPGGEKDVSHDGTFTWQSPAGRELRIDIPALFRGL